MSSLNSIRLDQGEGKRTVSRSTGVQGSDDVKIPAMMFCFEGNVVGVVAANGTTVVCASGGATGTTCEGRDEGGRFSASDDCAEGDGIGGVSSRMGGFGACGGECRFGCAGLVVDRAGVE